MSPQVKITVESEDGSFSKRVTLSERTSSELCGDIVGSRTTKKSFFPRNVLSEKEEEALVDLAKAIKAASQSRT